MVFLLFAVIKFLIIKICMGMAHLQLLPSFAFRDIVRLVCRRDAIKDRVERDFELAVEIR